MQLESKVKAVKEVKTYGHLTINSAEFPFVKNLKIGSEAEFTIKVKVRELRQPDNWEISEQKLKPTDINAGIVILDIKEGNTKKVEKVEDEDS